MKPRIRKSKVYADLYVCFARIPYNEGPVVAGWGSTPFEAYVEWKRASAT